MKKRVSNRVWLGIGLAMWLVGIGLVGCRQPDRGAPVAIDAEKYLAIKEPPGAIPVGQARLESKDGDAVTVLGFIGGSTRPFIDDVAMFTIVDPRVPYCSDDEGCPTPWDYCCRQNEVKENIATVKLIDDTGVTVMSDARSALQLAELQLVVVTGQAERDEAGNLVVLAKQIYIKPQP